jgi:Tol biopolymer transport system component
LALTHGTRLGVYEVAGSIGEGGMGQVYRATDTTLGRQVAIKILPDAVAADPERLLRFEREAKTLASLNHPHIAAIYGFEKSAGMHALVMELVEGDDLSHRIARGPIPIDEALPIAKQIAEALEAAHEQGIIHRDLKPANIKVRSDGTVKVLDFGLAKAMEPAAGSSPSVSMSPTITTPAMTQAGIILGTAAYMSPEQARGKTVDRRTDIWAFGVVVFEMLTGRRAFVGDDISVTWASIMMKEPDWGALPSATPVGLRRLLSRCLRKDAKARMRDIGEARLQIEELISGATEDTAPALATQPRAGRRERIVWLIAGLAVLAVAALAVPIVLYVGRAAPEPVVTRFEIQTPPTSDATSFALSPDGRQLVFVATSEGAPRLWVRPLDRVTAQPLAGTEGASYPFWAPDGDAIGFFAGGKLKRINPADGAPQVLADAPAPRGGTWNRDGVILFAPTAFSPLMRIAATGGTPVAMTRLAAGQASHRWPQFLPDDRRFLFLVAFGSSATRGVYVGALDGGEPMRVLEAETAAVYAPPGVLLLVRQGVLVALDFDHTRGVVAGQPITVAQGVGLDPGVARGTFAVSSTGVLAHRASGGERRQLVWVDRAGTMRGTVGLPDENALGNPELSPDGQRVAVQRAVEGNVDLWMIEVGRGVPSRFTFDASAEGDPVWSPDGRRVGFRSSRNAFMDLFEKLASGAADEQPLLETAEPKAPVAWSPDGSLLLYATQDPKTGTDLWALPVPGVRPSTNAPQQARGALSESKAAGRAEPAEERKPFPVVQTPFDEAAGQFSPDGQWVAYESNESGPREVYVQPFPGPGRKWQVSMAGGNQPRWRPDGKELFYVAPDGRLMAVPVAVGADTQTLEAGAPMPLFATRLASGSGISGVVISSKPQYAVARDGRFLMNVAVEGATAPPITVVLNWQEEVKQRIPTR